MAIVVSRLIENTVGKGEIARFQKTRFEDPVKTKACSEKG